MTNSEKKNYDHRRAWIEDRLLLLAEVICIKDLDTKDLDTHKLVDK